jgi:hypothetical protein
MILFLKENPRYLTFQIQRQKDQSMPSQNVTGIQPFQSDLAFDSCFHAASTGTPVKEEELTKLQIIAEESFVGAVNIAPAGPFSKSIAEAAHQLPSHLETLRSPLRYGPTELEFLSQLSDEAFSAIYSRFVEKMANHQWLNDLSDTHTDVAVRDPETAKKSGMYGEGAIPEIRSFVTSLLTHGTLPQEVATLDHAAVHELQKDLGEWVVGKLLSGFRTLSSGLTSLASALQSSPMVAPIDGEVFGSALATSAEQSAASLLTDNAALDEVQAKLAEISAPTTWNLKLDQSSEFERHIIDQLQAQFGLSNSDTVELITAARTITSLRLLGTTDAEIAELIQSSKPSLDRGYCPELQEAFKEKLWQFRITSQEESDAVLQALYVKDQLSRLVIRKEIQIAMSDVISSEASI